MAHVMLASDTDASPSAAKINSLLEEVYFLIMFS